MAINTGPQWVSVQRINDYGELRLKWDNGASISCPFLPRLRNHIKGESRKIVEARNSWGLQWGSVCCTWQQLYMWTQSSGGFMHTCQPTSQYGWGKNPWSLTSVHGAMGDWCPPREEESVFSRDIPPEMLATCAPEGSPRPFNTGSTEWTLSFKEKGKQDIGRGKQWRGIGRIGGERMRVDLIKIQLMHVWNIQLMKKYKK